MRQRCSGQAIVEFSIVSLLLFLMTFGVIEGGRFVFTYHEVRTAAKEGARYAAAHGCKADLEVSTPEPVRDHVLARATGLDPAAFTLNATWTRGLNVPADPEDAKCAAKPTVPGSTVKVIVAYQYEPVIGMVLGTDPLTLRAESQMRLHF